MQRTPVFLFAFANQQDAYLEALKGEERAIRECLSGRHDQQVLECLSLGSTSLEDIYRSFHRFHNRIAVFHYGGHSNSEALLLEGHSTRAANLATLMGMQDGLQLVVLNGCSNRAQAQTLLDAGVKVVVGTSCPIDDDKAGLFATQFYQGLASGSTIKQAFDGAISYLSDKRSVPAERVFRGLASRSGQEVPWALYYQNEEDLLWVAPASPAERRSPADFDYQEDVSIPHRKVNEALISQVAQGLGQYFPDIGQLQQQFRQAPHPELYLDLKDQVLKKYPSIISSHIAALFSPEARLLSRQRLYELNYTYLALCRYLTGIALSNLWEASVDENFQPRPGFCIPTELRQDVQQYLRLGVNDAPTFDYIWLLAGIHRILEANEAPLFMAELGGLHRALADDKATYDAYRFLHQELCQPVAAGKVHKDDIGELCLKAEHHLGLLLQKCAFLATYDLATIRDIRVSKGRRETVAAFLHDNGLLRGSNEKSIAIYPTPREDYTENQSVVVTKSFYQGERTLNLTPFLIDRNAFSTKKGGLPDIYFYYGLDQGKRCYQRASTMKDLYTVEKEEADAMVPSFNLDFDGMEVLYELFAAFSQDLKLQ